MDTRGNSAHWLFIAVIGTVFVALTVVFLFFPRSTYSELEKRDLKTFPAISSFGENPAAYTQAVSDWFSDSEPYRDSFMTLSMNIRNAMRVRIGAPEEAVSVKKTTGTKDVDMAVGVDDLNDINEAPDNPLANENAKLATSAVIVAGSGENVRGLMVFGGSSKAGSQMIDAANTYAEAFPNQNIYVLVAPLATEFYLPDKAASASRPQLPPLENIRNNLKTGIKFVDSYSNLAAHRKEDIYLRTDHHWAPLGAYYAAQAFAKTAGVPFRDLSAYRRHVIHRFVGSMYGYSNDIAFKNAPEDFVYYTPTAVDYTTTFVTYNVNKNHQVTSESKPYEAPYFKTYKDGSGLAYNTFMGGDQHLVKVKTSVPGNRKLLVIKDSYGNALPGYLFYSFPEIHVVDFRYFVKNMRQYVKDNGITDILLAFNIFNACNSSAMNKVKHFLDQNGAYAPHSVETEKAQAKPSEKDKAEEKPEEAQTPSPAGVLDESPVAVELDEGNGP